jgi:hypothetical protein
VSSGVTRALTCTSKLSSSDGAADGDELLQHALLAMRSGTRRCAAYAAASGERSARRGEQAAVAHQPPAVHITSVTSVDLAA